MPENIFEKDYKIYLIGFFIIAALPFINFQPWLSPPSWGKVMIFRIIVSFFSYLFLYRIISERKYSIFSELRKNKTVIVLAVLALLYILSTIFSQNPHFSFWGSPLRSGGSLNYISYIIFAVLAFLIIKKPDWRKLIDFSLAVGSLVALVAVFQKLRIFSFFIIPRTERAIGTMGGAPFFALYVSLLAFLALSLGIKTETKKRYLYLACFALFVLGVVLSGSRGALLAIIIGFLFYVLLYPKKKLRKLKIAFTGGLIVLILIFFGLASQPQLVEKIGGNKIIGNAFQRVWSTVNISVDEFSLFNIASAVFKDRVGAGMIAIEGIKEKPVFGFGPENFSIVFDKYLKLSLPGFSLGERWWDRAHNIVFDTASTVGIPALITLISLFFLLFWNLRKKKPEHPLMIHAIQAAFIVYIINNLFNFDVFSTYLIFFFLIAYSLSLIYKKPDLQIQETERESSPFRTMGLVLAFIGLIIFLWIAAFKPLWINKEINVATSFLNQGKRELAIETVEKVLSEKSVIDNYLKLQYVEILNLSMSMKPGPSPETRLMMTRKGVNALKQSIELRPNYTRSWWALNIYTNYLMGATGKMAELKDEAVWYCQRALELSPQHWKISKDCLTTYIIIEDYEEAIKMADYCIGIKPLEGICWFRKSLAYIGLGELELAEEGIEEAKERNYPEYPQLNLINSYSEILKKTKDAKTKEYLYNKIVESYKELIAFHLNFYGEENPQYHGSLAYIYKEMGDYDNAKKEAGIFLELAPNQKEQVEQFLKDLQ